MNLNTREEFLLMSTSIRKTLSSALFCTVCLGSVLALAGCGSSATSPAAGAVTGAAGSSTASAGGGSTGGSGLGSGGGSTASSGGSATGAIATTSSVSGDATGGLVTTLGNTVSTVGTQLSSTGSTTGGPLGAIVDGLGGTVTQTGDLLSGTGSTLTTSGLTGLPVVGPTVTGVADAVDPVTNALADVTVLNTSTGSSTVTPLLSANVLSTSPQPNAPVQVGVLSNGQVVQLKVGSLNTATLPVASTLLATANQSLGGAVGGGVDTLANGAGNVPVLGGA
ncbi:MAG: hypothetical protein KGK13_02605, partial [Rhodospirillales bacterium]|nr:hypothetical protein [Rhodospirillales bacterium]